MFKALFKLALLLVILVAVGGFLLGWWGGNLTSRDANEIGTSGEAVADRARDAGAEIGDRAATAANQAKNALEDGGLTAKIKSKMALDDTIEASRINVDTANRIVTLTGTVETDAQRQRALQLARETDGVKNVVDRIKVAR
jgi:hyperosmotically inducible protein